MRYFSQPLPLKRCQTAYQEDLPSSFNFYSLHITSSAPPREKRNSSSSETRIQIKDIQRHADHLFLKGHPESPLLYASPEDLQQQVLYSEFKRTIPSSPFKEASVPILRTQGETVHDSAICSDFKNGPQFNLKAAAVSPDSDIIDTIPSLISSSVLRKFHFTPSTSNKDGILPEAVDILKDDCIHIQEAVQKEHLPCSPTQEISLKASQEFLEQFRSVNSRCKNHFCVTNGKQLNQAHDTIALKGDFAENEKSRVNDDAENDNILNTGKKGDSCSDHYEKFQSMEHSSDVENKFIQSKFNHDFSGSKMLLLNGPESKSYEEVSGKELLLSPLSSVGVRYRTLATKDIGIPNSPSTHIFSSGYIKFSDTNGNITIFEENVQQYDSIMKTNDEDLSDKDDRCLEPNKKLQDMETSRQKSNKSSKEPHYYVSQKLDKSHEDLHNLNKSKTEIYDSDETLHVSDECSEESDQSSQETGECSYKYTDQLQDPRDCFQDVDENFHLPNCNDCSQGSIGSIITFSPLTGIDDNELDSICPLSETSVSSSANSPTNVSVFPMQGYSKESLERINVGGTFNDFDLKDESIKVISSNVLLHVDKNLNGVETRVESLDELRKEGDLSTKVGNFDFEVPSDTKIENSGIGMETITKFRDEFKTSNDLSPKILEKESVQYEDSNVLKNETSAERASYFATNPDKVINVENLANDKNKEQSTQISYHCCSRHEARRDAMKNIKKETSLTISPVTDNIMNDHATFKADTDSCPCETFNTTQEQEMILEEIKISHSLKHSTSQYITQKSSENYQPCPSALNCKDWLHDKSVIQPLKTRHCQGGFYHLSKVYPIEDCSIGHDITTEQVVPDNESVPHKCPLRSKEHNLDDFQTQDMYKLQLRSPSSSVYMWPPLVPMLNDSLSQTSCNHVSESKSVVSSLAPPFSKTRSIRVGLSKHQKVKRLHTKICK